MGVGRIETQQVKAEHSDELFGGGEQQHSFDRLVQSETGEGGGVEARHEPVPSHVRYDETRHVRERHQVDDQGGKLHDVDSPS